MLAGLAWLPAAWIAGVAQLLSGLPGARSAWPGGLGGVALLVLVEVALLAGLLATGRVRRMARVVGAVAVLAYAASTLGAGVVVRAGRPADWQYALCDVGQGDALLVRSGSAVALVDTGPEPGRLHACLDDLGIARLDLVVLTHFDLDHVGGWPELVGGVDRVLTGPPGEPADERILAELAAGGASITRTARGDRGTLGALAWEVLWPPPSGAPPGNEASVAVRWSCASPAPCLTAVLLGDLGAEEQTRLAGAVPLGRVDVVKVAHHGSADQSAPLYAALAATVGLIGVGAGNDYGHPTEALLGILAAAGTTPVRSDTDGLVLVAPGEDPGAVEVWTAR